MIGAGKLDRRIDIKRRALSRDPGTDAVIEGFTDHMLSVPAGIREVSGREILEAGAIMASKIAIFTIRFADVVATDQVIWEGRTFNIRDIRQVGRRRFLELQAEATNA